MRNPRWHRDEIILALDLYFDEHRGSIDASNPKVIEVSNIINKLPLFPFKPDAEKFRNPNGVSLKLSNFLAIDPNHLGKGMKSYSNLDKEVFDEFVGDKERLHALAKQIKTIAYNTDIVEEISKVEEDEQTWQDSVKEGQILYKLHKVRERDKKIIKLKKEQALDLHGVLQCEACTFDFEKRYGALGKGFIECHHITPLHLFETEKKTTLEDLALVCSNCHRMLHRNLAHTSIKDFMNTIIK